MGTELTTAERRRTEADHAVETARLNLNEVRREVTRALRVRDQAAKDFYVAYYRHLAPTEGNRRWEPN